MVQPTGGDCSVLLVQYAYGGFGDLSQEKFDKVSDNIDKSLSLAIDLILHGTEVM